MMAIQVAADTETAGARSERARPAAETVDRLRPYFEELGISRLARQTNLDRIGIPCFAAIRPNSRTLANHQGKGLTDDDARASAVMEAAELAIAERAMPVTWRGPSAHLESAGLDYFDPQRSLPFGTQLDRSLPIAWISGTSVFSGRSALVPVDLVRMDASAPDLPGVSQNSNGLASGNTREEAEFHGLCELIERDATTLWTLRSDAWQAGRCVAASAFGSSELAHLADRIDDAGLVLRLFDLTSDIAIPTIMAVVGPKDARRLYEVTAGFATHPVAARAAVRAITEAAQSRITIIAGSRDDLEPVAYGEIADEGNLALLTATPSAEVPVGVPAGASLAAMMDMVSAAFRRAGADEPIAVPLGGDAYGISVVRLLAHGLEDRGANANWRPGPRAIKTLVDAQ